MAIQEVLDRIDNKINEIVQWRSQFPELSLMDKMRTLRSDANTLSDFCYDLEEAIQELDNETNEEQEQEEEESPREEYPGEVTDPATNSFNEIYGRGEEGVDEFLR